MSTSGRSWVRVDGDDLPALAQDFPVSAFDADGGDVCAKGSEVRDALIVSSEISAPRPS